MKRFHSDGIFHYSLFTLLPSGRSGGGFHSSFIGSQIRLLESTPVEDDALNHLSCVDAFELEGVLFEGFVDRYTQCEFLAVLQHLLFPRERPFGELVFQNDWGLSIHTDAEAIALSFVDREEWQTIDVEREDIGRDGSRGVVG